ncbi:hypothetical protein PF010_g30660 [Phytophthora fragariae]|uniref:Uncharacterized protein n=1 Tax=Phytophthora fragariae TaxID=53985 RepID=A0A6G0JKH9_9STRA|nr:hypothetical protein PF010_g30660 [Phytophthora fragariae]
MPETTNLVASVESSTEAPDIRRRRVVYSAEAAGIVPVDRRRGVAWRWPFGAAVCRVDAHTTPCRPCLAKEQFVVRRVWLGCPDVDEERGCGDDGGDCESELDHGMSSIGSPRLVVVSLN